MLRDEQLYSECYSMRDNLKFYGIPESKGEDCEALILEVCHAAGFELDSVSIVYTHRVGQYKKNSTRPIIVHFFHCKDRDLVWNVHRDIHQEQGMGVAEDYPAINAAHSKCFFPILTAAFNFRDPNNPAFWYKGRVIVGKLILNGKVTRWKSPLLNYYPCVFTVNDKKYNCMEQYLMRTKALHFKDTDIAAKLMQTDNP